MHILVFYMQSGFKYKTTSVAFVVSMLITIAICMAPAVAPAAAQPGVASLTVVTTISVPASPFGIAVHPTLNRVFVSARNNNELAVINTSNNTLSTTISIGFGPHSVVVDPTASRVYVSHVDGLTVSVLDAQTYAALGTVLVPGNPVGIDVDPLRQRAYVVHGAIYLTQIALTDSGGIVSTTINTGSNGANGYVTVHPVLNRAYVAKTGTVQGVPGSIAVINLATNTLITDVLTLGPMDDLAINTVTNRVYATHPAQDAVIVLDASSNVITNKIEVRGGPTDIAVNTVKNCIYAISAFSNTLTLIDGATNQIRATIGVGNEPKAVAVNTSTGLIYVANRGNNTVTVVRDTICASPVQVPPTVTPKPATARTHLPIAFAGDAFESSPNDTVGAAQAITSGKRIAGKLEDAYDVFSFDANAGPVTIRLLDVPSALSERVQLAVYRTDDFATSANRKLFDITAPWEGAFAADSGRYYVTLFTDPAYRQLMTPYRIEVNYP
jgi:YVTN family beta-propeller protein